MISMTSAGMVMRKHLPLIMLLLLSFDLFGENKSSTASRGAYQAWRILALKQEKLKNENAANELWKKFIAADREHRRQDRYDIFYPQIKINIKLQPWMMSPEEIQEYRTRLEKTVNIEIADD